MKNTASAAATGLPDRRLFLSTIAGAGALGLPALPALAGVPGPIEAMWLDYLRAEAALDAATAHTSDAERHYKAPPRPVWHPFYEEGGYVNFMTGPGRGISVLDDGTKNIACLNAIIAKEHEPDDLRFGYSNGPRAERARKTLAKIEAWQGEVKRRKDAAGLTEAETAEKEASAKRFAQIAAILAIDATSFRELAFQAAVLIVEWDETHVDRLLNRFVELAGVTPYDLA